MPELREHRAGGPPLRAGRIELLTGSLRLALDQGHHEYVARGYTNLAEMLYRYESFDDLRELPGAVG